MRMTFPRRVDARVLRALAVAYHMPTPQLCSAEFLCELGDALTAAGVPGLLQHVDAMGEGLQETPEPTALTVEYCKLFYGPGKVAAPPYESVYLGGGVTMGEPAIAVVRKYQEAGVQVWEGFRNCPDHIAAELEFLYFAAGEAANFRALGREETARIWAERYNAFLREHLSRWVARFCRKIEEGTEQKFYLGLARLTAAVVEDAAR